MKKLFLLGLLACAFAGNPDQVAAKAANPLTFQGSLKAVDGKAVTKTMNMTFKIYNQEAGGAAIWTENNAVAVENGYFNVYLGRQQDLDIDFSQECWIEITLDNGDVLPRTLMTGTPYSFQAGIASQADTATVAMDVLDGVLTWEKFNDEAKVAGGILTGTYPNPGLNATEFVDQLPQYGIPGDKITPGTYTHISTAPAGPAYGDLEGSNFPNLYIAPGKITNEHLQVGAVKALNLSSDGANADQVLIPDGNGGVVWADVPSPLNKLGNGTTYGQMFFWDGNEWQYTHNVAPRNGQVLKFDENVGLFRWMDDDGFSIPFINDNVATLNEDAIRVKKTDGSLGNILDLSNQSSQGQEVVVINGRGDRAFDNGVLHVDAATNNNIQGESKAATFHQTVSTDSNTGSTAVEVSNTIENCTICDNCTGTGSLHVGVEANTVIAGELGTSLGVNAIGQGGYNATGIAATATGGANGNVGVAAIATGGTKNYGVYATTSASEVQPPFFDASNAPAVDNAAVYAQANGNAVYATGNATGENYIAQVVNTNGRGLNVEGAPVNQTGLLDGNAVIVANNKTETLNPAVVALGGAGKTAIKTYGDIWANGAMGANAVVAPKVVVGDADNNSQITLNNDNLYISTGAEFNGDVKANNFNANNGVIIGDPATNNGVLTVNGTTNLGATNVNGAAIFNDNATFLGNVTMQNGATITNANLITPTLNTPTINGETQLNGTLTVTGPVTAPSFVGDLTGNATTATTATNLTGNITTDQVTGLSAFVQGVKVDNATHADNADLATNATTAANLTGNITTEQVTGLAEFVKGVKVDNAAQADNATLAATATLANTVANTAAAGESVINAINAAGGINIDKAHLPATIAYEDENNTFTRDNRFEGITTLAGTTNVSNQFNLSGNTVISGTTIISTPNATVTGEIKPVAGGIVAANQFIMDPAGTNMIDLSEMAAPTDETTDAQFIQWDAATGTWGYTTINMTINAGTIGTNELENMATITAGTYGDGNNIPVVTVDVDGRVSGISTTPIVEADPKVGTLTNNTMPVWDGTQTKLVDSPIVNTALGVAIGANTTVTGNLSATQNISGALVLSNATATDLSGVTTAINAYKSVIFYTGTVDIVLPDLAAADAGKVVYIVNAGSAAPSINLNSLLPNTTAGFVWSGTAWFAL